MSEHVLSILVKAVGTGEANRQLKGLNRTISNLGSHVGKGLRSAAHNIANFAKVAAVGLGAATAQGIQSLATLESAVMQVDGAIKQMGLTGKVTSAQVAAWSNEIESAVGAAFDDKDITAATANLIRFGSVTPRNLRKSMEVMTDLAAKTGDVSSASSLLGKVMADPIKASGKLARVGIVLTKEQQHHIAVLMRAGKAGKAQAYILDLLAKKTKGAAAATQGPAQRAWSELKDTWEDATRALAVGLLPVLTEASKWLKSKLADPKVIEDIKRLGQSLADGFKGALEFAKKIPWDSIKSAMQAAGTGAKAAWDLFNGLPDWVKTAVITGWGLNKLTGGAVGSIVGELGKGLIKGVLGMTAGVVNINAGVVNGGGGGIPGIPAAAGIGAGLATVTIVGIAAVAALAIGQAINDATNRDRSLTTTAARHDRSVAQGGSQGGRSGGRIPTGIPLKLPVKTLPVGISAAERRLLADANVESNRISDRIEQSRIAQDHAATLARAGFAGVKGAIQAKRLSVTTKVDLRNNVNVRTTISGRDVVANHVSQSSRTHSGIMNPAFGPQ